MKKVEVSMRLTRASSKKAIDNKTMLPKAVVDDASKKVRRAVLCYDLF